MKITDDAILDELSEIIKNNNISSNTMIPLYYMGEFLYINSNDVIDVIRRRKIKNLKKIIINKK
jgi:hypothetical protein